MMYNARIAALMLGLAFSVPSSYTDPPSPQRLHDMLWVWGNPEMGRPGPHTAATFAEASPAARATLLGAPNVVLAGNGLPADDTAALAVSEEVRGAQRLVWEIASDESAGGAPFTYTETIARVRRVAAQFPQLEGVLLDDMSSVQVDKGLKPEHLHAIPEALGEDHARLRVWGVLYTMNFGVPGIDEYIRELDVINLWTWLARDIPNLEANVATCEQRYPGKPIVLGLYLYDYGEGRPMPRALLAQQCETALKLAQAGRIKGIVFLTINNDAAAVDWVRDWVEEHGDLPLTAPAPKELRMTDAAQWQFLGGPWSETPEGVIQPQDAPNLHSRAFYLPESYEDIDVEFEFNGNYRETGTGSAGFILRAADANHFYYVWFPWGGQQLRAKHFWAAVAKVDGDGYMRNIAMEWVPGVPSETDRWYKVRIEAHGPRLRVWVDGRSALEVTDGAYTGGRIG
ncbi:MAG: DUF1080 domain-containing protein, partial [Candidatus Hydrogenedentes bacterium]|nr:DUF1080 domain-containing protein [Candidatus Hydrogenedentota bacterium]